MTKSKITPFTFSSNGNMKSKKNKKQKFDNIGSAFISILNRF